jgi:hypothetical protein
VTKFGHSVSSPIYDQASRKKADIEVRENNPDLKVDALMPLVHFVLSGDPVS